jgi:hypothetical protein
MLADLVAVVNSYTNMGRARVSTRIPYFPCEINKNIVDEKDYYE